MEVMVGRVMALGIEVIVGRVPPPGMEDRVGASRDTHDPLCCAGAPPQERFTACK
jgi:hypothetical protein